MEGADDLVEFEERGGENLSLDEGGEGETMTASAAEDLRGHISSNVLCSLRRCYSLRYVVQYIKMQLMIKKTS